MDDEEEDDGNGRNSKLARKFLSSRSIMRFKYALEPDVEILPSAPRTRVALSCKPTPCPEPSMDQRPPEVLRDGAERGRERRTTKFMPIESDSGDDV